MLTFLFGLPWLLAMLFLAFAHLVSMKMRLRWISWMIGTSLLAWLMFMIYGLGLAVRAVMGLGQ